MIRKGFVLGTLSILVVVFVYWGTSSGAKDCGGIPAERVADMVHAVIESKPYLLHSPCRGANAGERRRRRFGKLAGRKDTSPPSSILARVSPVGSELESQDWIQAHRPLAYQQTEWAQNRIRA